MLEENVNSQVKSVKRNILIDYYEPKFNKVNEEPKMKHFAAAALDPLAVKAQLAKLSCIKSCLHILLWTVASPFSFAHKWLLQAKLKKSFCPSVCLSVSPSFYLSICLSVCLSVTKTLLGFLAPFRIFKFSRRDRATKTTGLKFPNSPSVHLFQKAQLFYN